MEWVRGKCVGKGAFGTVHVAVDRATGRAFAVKSVEAKSAPAAAAMACLESEIRILRRLSSPYVVEYLGDDGNGATTRNLHMELVLGGSAAEAAVATGGLGEGGARGILRRVAAALRYLHDVAGVVHGDVKGRNVLVGCDGGGAKLADFGAARLISDTAVPRGPRGTPAWMAPEVARGGTPTPASDVWSLGCTAVELLTGKRPWSELGGACEIGELLFLIGFGGKRPELPACLSDSCGDFLDKCLRRDAGERWSCDQLLRHPFLSAADTQEPSPFPSPRAVLDWAASMSDSDSDDSNGTEAGSEHEVMARAKGRLAELASNASWGREWEAGPTWEAADTWAPLSSPEAVTNTPVPSNPAAVADAGGAAAIAGGRGSVLAVATAGVGRDRCDSQYGAYPHTEANTDPWNMGTDSMVVLQINGYMMCLKMPWATGIHDNMGVVQAQKHYSNK
ncbi:mitogen-activated protein kinase kinase kinase 18-like [Oryza brachyantha]|uniref:mitogen-activated protein kinase kinase kinase 18-like n=1 Tax=Oryza brachyantha TaxID=4533 RepID=UPI001ADB9139|nr:mitogen-activated protein kinase kinase kinase 18-like [Oryza brachyantha]